MLVSSMITTTRLARHLQNSVALVQVLALVTLSATTLRTLEEGAKLLAVHVGSPCSLWLIVAVLILVRILPILATIFIPLELARAIVTIRGLLVLRVTHKHRILCLPRGGLL